MLIPVTERINAAIFDLLQRDQSLVVMRRTDIKIGELRFSIVVYPQNLVAVRNDSGRVLQGYIVKNDEIFQGIIESFYREDNFVFENLPLDFQKRGWATPEEIEAYHESESISRSIWEMFNQDLINFGVDEHNQFVFCESKRRNS